VSKLFPRVQVRGSSKNMNQVGARLIAAISGGLLLYGLLWFIKSALQYPEAFALVYAGLCVVFCTVVEVSEEDEKAND